MGLGIGLAVACSLFIQFIFGSTLNYFQKNIQARPELEPISFAN